MPKNEFDGLPVIEAGEDIKFAVSVDDLQAGDAKDPAQHPSAIALKRARGIDDARVCNSETLIRRGKRWYRYDAIDKQSFKELQKTLTGD
jgi:hypothetical protein